MQRDDFLCGGIARIRAAVIRSTRSESGLVESDGVRILGKAVQYASSLLRYVWDLLLESTLPGDDPFANPLAGTRVPVAVLATRPSGGVEIILAPHVPDAECLGSARASNAIRLMRPAIQRLNSFDELPTVFGPQFSLAEAAVTPMVDDAIAWVRRAVFPEMRRDKPMRSPRRATMGKQWLNHNGVGQWVQTGFVPEGTNLDRVSHYVEGRDRLLLMEPLVPRKLLEELHADTRTISTRLHAHHDVLERKGTSAELFAYLLPGPYETAFLRDVEQDLEFARVINCNVHAQAEDFLRTIRENHGFPMN